MKIIVSLQQQKIFSRLSQLSLGQICQLVIQYFSVFQRTARGSFLSKLWRVPIASPETTLEFRIERWREQESSRMKSSYRSKVLASSAKQVLGGQIPIMLNWPTKQEVSGQRRETFFHLNFARCISHLSVCIKRLCLHIREGYLHADAVHCQL